MKYFFVIHFVNYDDYYKILPSIHNWATDEKRIGSGSKVAENFSYVSNTNPDWMHPDELAEWIDKNRAKLV